MRGKGGSWVVSSTSLILISILVLLLAGSAAGATGNAGTGAGILADENGTTEPLDEHPSDPGNQTVGPHEYARFEGNVSTSAVEREIYEEINRIRTGDLDAADLELYNLSANLNLAAWTTADPLASAARAQSAHLADTDYFAHTTPAGKEFADWYYEDMNRDCGDCYLVQNIAKTGFFIDGMPREDLARTGDRNETIARLIVSQFMHSGSHKTLIASSEDGEMGVGVHIDQFSLYTTQNLKLQFERGGADTASVETTGSTVASDSGHESGVSQRLYDAVAGTDGDLSRADVLSLVDSYASGDPVGGLDVDRSDVLAVIRYYTSV